MNDNNYIVIQGWMITRLGLDGSGLMAYALVYGYTKDGSQWYRGGRKELAEWAGLSLKRAGDALNSLVEKGFLRKEDFRVNGAKRCMYQAVQPSPADATPGSDNGTPCLTDDANVDNRVDNYVDNYVDNCLDSSAGAGTPSNSRSNPRDKTSLGSETLGTKRPNPRDKTSPTLGTKRPLRNNSNNNIYNTGLTDGQISLKLYSARVRGEIPIPQDYMAMIRLAAHSANFSERELGILAKELLNVTSIQIDQELGITSPDVHLARCRLLESLVDDTVRRNDKEPIKNMFRYVLTSIREFAKTKVWPEAVKARCETDGKETV